MNINQQEIKPNIFEFHSYREFLNKLFDYVKSQDGEFSMRGLARKSQLAASLLPMVLSGNRVLTRKSLQKLLPHLPGLDENEKTYLSLLRDIEDGSSAQIRMSALKQMQRHQQFRENKEAEFEVYKYMGKWYIPVIRELVATEGFKFDAKWIQKKLAHHIPLSEINTAMEFLKKFHFVKRRNDGSYALPQKNVDCTGGVFQVVLADFHRQMLDLAAASINKTEKEKRNLSCYTFALPEKNFPRVRQILKNAEEQLAALEAESEDKDTVYHVEFAAFPLTRG